VGPGRAARLPNEFGAFLAEKTSGESSFSAVLEIIASAHKTRAFQWRKIGKRREISMGAPLNTYIIFPTGP